MGGGAEIGGGAELRRSAKGRGTRAHQPQSKAPGPGSAAVRALACWISGSVPGSRGLEPAQVVGGKEEIRIDRLASQLLPQLALPGVEDILLNALHQFRLRLARIHNHVALGSVLGSGADRNHQVAGAKNGGDLQLLIDGELKPLCN